MNSQNNAVSWKPWSVCDDCGEVIDSLGRCGCDYRRSPSRMPGGNGHGRANWNSGVVALIAALIIALSLMQPARADSQPQPTLTPTTAVGGGPQITVGQKVFLPFISIDDGVGGQGRYWGGQ